jgi:hypothetical protein
MSCSHLARILAKFRPHAGPAGREYAVGTDAYRPTPAALLLRSGRDLTHSDPPR